ncbi:hypothetical protein MKZ02_20035 [Pseudobacillus sp. FSL P4-0506]|uniref:hypothetical protein n=1 Tax=Pseudobacillus sp. FSL P4-0506 TaxID=2921576 RepID=UPI0030F944B2
MDKCQHEWVDIEDSTNDQICSKCGIKQMQAVIKVPHPITESIVDPILQPMVTPIMREKIEIVRGDGKRVSVYKDEWEEEFWKAQGLYISPFND